MVGQYDFQTVKLLLIYPQMITYTSMVLNILIGLTSRGAKYFHDDVEIKSNFFTVG